MPSTTGSVICSSSARRRRRSGPDDERRLRPRDQRAAARVDARRGRARAAAGATVLTGGERLDRPGFYIAPTIVEERRGRLGAFAHRALRADHDPAARRRLRGGDRRGERQPVRSDRGDLDREHPPGPGVRSPGGRRRRAGERPHLRLRAARARSGACATRALAGASPARRHSTSTPTGRRSTSHTIPHPSELVGEGVPYRRGAVMCGGLVRLRCLLLSAELRQRVDHDHPQLAETRVVGGEKAGGTGPDDTRSTSRCAT